MPSNATSPTPSRAQIEVARLFPGPGDWTEDDYLLLSKLTNQRIELADGCLEVLEMPTRTHQMIVQLLFLSLHEYVKARTLGRVVIGGYPFKVVAGRFRQPDLLYISRRNDRRAGEEFAEKIDVAFEIVSQDRKRDYRTKREDYAKASVSEYWIVDADKSMITVLTLNNDVYEVAGTYRRGQTAKSNLLRGWTVDVGALFADARK